MSPETEKSLLSDVKEIKDALLGTYDKKGIISKVCEHDKILEVINEKKIIETVEFMKGIGRIKEKILYILIGTIGSYILWFFTAGKVNN